MAIKKSPPVVHFTAKMDKILHEEILFTYLFIQPSLYVSYMQVIKIHSV